MLDINQIRQLLGNQAASLLDDYKPKVSSDRLTLPSPDTVEKVWLPSDRSPQVLRNLQSLLSHGRLADTGYVSILPVDQGIEHSAAASLSPTPGYFDPANIVELAL